MIETERLGLRNLESDDNETLSEILSDKETMKYYPRPYNQKETEAGIARSIQSYQEKGFGLWAVILKKGGRFIGQCGISMQDIDGDWVPEIGYHIHKNFWNGGFATEASLGSLDYGFSKCGLQEIFVHTSVKNTPSIRVAEKIGMKKRKEYDKAINQSNDTIRHVVYSLKRNAWPKKYKG